MKLKIALVDDVESDLLLLETDLMCAAKGRHQITFLKYKSEICCYQMILQILILFF